MNNLTKREMFAMNAPDVPDWFMSKHCGDEQYGFYHGTYNSKEWRFGLKGKEKIFFEWRWHYADMMLQEGEK